MIDWQVHTRTPPPPPPPCSLLQYQVYFSSLAARQGLASNPLAQVEWGGRVWTCIGLETVSVGKHSGSPCVGVGARVNAPVFVYAVHVFVWYVLLQRWAPVAIGLLSIPAIIHPIDDFTDSMMNKTYGGVAQDW